VLTLLNRFEDVLIRHRRRHGLTVVFAEPCNSLEELGSLLDTLREKNVKTSDLKVEKMADTESAQFRITLSRGINFNAIETMLVNNPQILHHEWQE
jgi:hypothetical protein